MSAKKKQISERLNVLLSRLRDLETQKPAPHQEPIVQVGIQALRDKIRDLGRQIEAC